MSASPSVLPHSILVTRLRAAGCVFAEDEADVLVSTARTPAELAAMVDQRIDGIPLERVLGWPEGRIEILLSNVPYVPTEDVRLLPPEARIHEPRVTLDGGSDGLEVLRRVTAEAHLWLAPGGHLLVETSERQAPLAAEIFTRDGLTPRVAISEELNATVIIGTRPTS